MKPLHTALLLCLTLLLTHASAQVTQQPPLNTFQMRAALQGTHPRLYFTQDDIADIRAAGLGSRQWYLDRAHNAFGGYIGDPVNVDASWKDYLYGFWGQFAMNMFWIVEQDTVASRTARDWALHYAGRTDWIADDLIPNDILAGMSITYDIQYDNFTPEERTTLRNSIKASIDFMFPEFLIDEYWTNDFQNNHMHNRLNGFSNAVFAIYGDSAGIDVQAEADLALGCWEDVVEWLPPDGSNHEGPGYWDYGNHWVVRLTHLMSHVTGTDYAAQNSHFATDYLFRLYMTTPGWQHTFGVGDANEGAPSNTTCWTLPIAEQGDARALSVLQELMDEVSGGFYQHAAWGLLWYDGDLTPEPYATMPLGRFWPDLEMLTVRSSWDSLATAFLFKCGPPGGHHMNQLAPGWINVAHDHPDQNHFMIFANGEMLAQDDNYPRDQKLARSHNTLTVDGEGQTREGSAWYQPFDYGATGSMDDMLMSGATAYAAGNAGVLYQNADRFIRHAFFVESEYAVIIDDVAAAGGVAREWDWRLHCDGTWTDQGSGVYTVDKGDATLRITWVAPQTHTASFLDSELTAKPCVSITHTAEEALLATVLEPDAATATARTVLQLSAGDHMALSIASGGTTDIVLVKQGLTTINAGTITTNAAAAVVREDGGTPGLVVCVNGSYVVRDGFTLVDCFNPMDMVRREVPNGASLEISPPYGETGGTQTVTVGGLMTVHAYTVWVDGIPQETVTSDGEGGVVFDVVVDTTRFIEILDASAVRATRNVGANLGAMRVTARGGSVFVTVPGLSDGGRVRLVAANGRSVRVDMRGGYGRVDGLGAGVYGVEVRVGEGCVSRVVAVVVE